MQTNQINQINKIKEDYIEKEQTNFDKLKELDKKVKRPAQIFAYVLGSISSLVLGTGMCLAMKVIGNAMALGIVIGVVGIALVSANYFIYKKILSSRKNKYKNQVLELADEVLNK